MNINLKNINENNEYLNLQNNKLKGQLLEFQNMNKQKELKL